MTRNNLDPSTFWIPIVVPRDPVTVEIAQSPLELLEWEALLREGFGLETTNFDSTRACSVTYPDGGGATCDDHGFVGDLSGFNTEDLQPFPLMMPFGPVSYQPLSSREDLVDWEQTMAKRLGVEVKLAEDSTATDTQSGWAGNGRQSDDCDIAGPGSQFGLE